MKSWERPYTGDAADTLYEMLCLYSKIDKELYSRTVPMLQSSGTGKSRTIDEFSKTNFVIPSNLREEGTTGQGRLF
jgi:hypothetical protein